MLLFRSFWLPNKLTCFKSPFKIFSLQPAEQPTVNSSTSTPVLRPTTPTLGEDQEPNSQELVRLLQEKDRRIQFLEVKIQQLTQVGYSNWILGGDKLSGF